MDYVSELEHQGSHITVVLTRNYVVTAPRLASVEYQATLGNRCLASPLALCAKGTIFLRYASVGKECRQCGGIC